MTEEQKAEAKAKREAEKAKAAKEGVIVAKPKKAAANALPPPEKLPLDYAIQVYRYVGGLAKTLNQIQA